MTGTLTESPATATAPATDPTGILSTYKRAPMRFVSGSGVELFDDAGNAYIDFASGIAVNALGYRDPGIRDVITEVLESGLIHVSNLYRTDAGERLANVLVANTFASSVFFCNSGAEANEGAFKFARRWGRATGTDAKTGIVALRGSFHGRLFASLAATDPGAHLVAGYPNVMPTFQGKLTGPQTAAIVEYIKTLRTPDIRTGASQGPTYEPIQ
jgi:acetylornithine/succinyldiaminopimelate/putrescine aminotransferase